MLPRALGRTGAALGGGVAGGLVGGPLGAVLGAMTASGLGETARQYIHEPKIDPRKIVEQVASGGAGELLGRTGGAVVMRPGGEMTKRVGPEVAKDMATAERYGIPLRASEVTGSRATRMLEAFPERFPLGTTRPQRFTERQLAGLEQGMKRQVPVPSPPESLTAIGLDVQRDIPKAVTNWKRESESIFRRVEVAAGDQPVVDISALVNKAKALADETQVLPVPGAVTKSMGLGTVPPQVAKMLGLSPGQVPSWWPQTNLVPFKQARQIEKELGAASKYSANPLVGTIPQGQVRALYGEARRAVDDFVSSPAGAALGPDLAAAKQLWRTGKETLTNGVNAHLMKARPEEVVNMAFGKGLEGTLDFRLAVSPTTWDASRTAWMAGLIDKASPQGRFAPQRFAKIIKPYLDNGQFETVFGADRAKEFRDLSDLSSRMKGANVLAENPSGTGQAILGAEQIGQLAKLGAAPITLALGGSPAAIAGAGAAAMLPSALGVLTTSRPGIDLLIQGMSRKFTPFALRTATHLVAQSVMAGDGEMDPGGAGPTTPPPTLPDVGRPSAPRPPSSPVAPPAAPARPPALPPVSAPPSAPPVPSPLLPQTRQEPPSLDITPSPETALRDYMAPGGTKVRQRIGSEVVEWTKTGRNEWQGWVGGVHRKLTGESALNMAAQAYR